MNIRRPKYMLKTKQSFQEFVVGQKKYLAKKNGLFDEGQ